jgi:PRTRC genetic system protein B
MSNELTASLKPKHQIVIYEGSQNTSYVEHYEVLEIDGSHFLSEGKPLTKKTLKKIMNLVMTTGKNMFATVKQLLPENVIYYDPRPGMLKLIWYNKPMVRIMHGIYKHPVKVKIPAILYMLHDDDLSIFIMKTGTRRPELKTPLFRAPFPNIYERGNVCMGNVKKPTGTVEIANLINSWEGAFWNSEFTNHLHSEDYGKEFTKSIRANIVFPNKQFKATKKTINTIINSHEKD